MASEALGQLACRGVSLNKEPGMDSGTQRRQPSCACALCLATAAVLAGCASAVNPQTFVGPSGNQAYSMKCSGMGRDWADCLQKAGELCPVGYSIVGQNSETVGVPFHDSMLIGPKRNLSVECD